MPLALIRSVLAYITAVIATASAKLTLVFITFGPAALMDLGHQFLFRTGLSHVAARDTPVGWAEFWNHAWAGLEALTPGMHSFAVGTLAISIMAAAWGYSRLRSAADSGGRLRAVALLGSMIVPPLWMVIFWQHTSEHAWFMDRILVWPIAAGGALFVFSLEANVVAAPSRR